MAETATIGLARIYFNEESELCGKYAALSNYLSSIFLEAYNSFVHYVNPKLKQWNNEYDNAPFKVHDTNQYNMFYIEKCKQICKTLTINNECTFIKEYTVRLYGDEPLFTGVLTDRFGNIGMTFRCITKPFLTKEEIRR